MSNITLITNKICPYARKANIALRQKFPEFKVVQEDLQNKSEFFKESYAKALGRVPGKEGTVPTIIDDGVFFTQSEPIVWYVAEKYQNEGYNLIPQDHVKRFEVRLFVEDFSKKIVSIMGKFFGWSKKTEEEKAKLLKELDEFFEKLNQKLVLPYAIGKEFTIADILIYPHLQLWGAVEQFTGLGIDKRFEKIHEFINEVQKRKSVKDLILPKEAYVEALRKFF